MAKNEEKKNEEKTLVENVQDKVETIQEKVEEKKRVREQEKEAERRKDTLRFDDYVFEKIAAIAAREVPGVLELRGGFFSNIAGAFASSTDTDTTGVSVEVDEQNVIIDLRAVLEYGQSAPRIFLKVKEMIKEKVKEMTGLDVMAVNMKVEDIMTEKEFKASKTDE